MNKAALIRTLAYKEDITAVKASEIVNLIFDGFKDALVRGERVEIRGFGSFAIREHKNYTGRNPRSGIAVKVKPRRLPFFKTGKELREKVNIIAIRT